MDIALYIVIVVAVMVVLVNIMQRKTVSQKKEYKYTKKQSVMTKSEQDFFNKLENILGNKYYIIPQAHLSMFLNEKVQGQNWQAAFRKINGKSIDFLLCEKGTSRQVVAIELDDYTHNRTDRINRDQIVESICKNAGILLVRFKEQEWGSEQLIYDKIVTQKDLWESDTKN